VLVRSNRSLTASDEAQHGSRAARRWARQRRGAKPRASASQKVFPGENRRSSPGALPTSHSREMQALFFAAQFAVGHGINGVTALEAKYLHLHCRKESPRRRSPHRGRRWGRRSRSPQGPRIRAPKPNRAGRAGLTRSLGAAPRSCGAPFRFAPRTGDHALIKRSNR